MGIRLRRYEPFIQPPITRPFEEYESNRAKLSNCHFSRFDTFPRTLYTLFDRLCVDSCSAVTCQLPLQSVDELSRQECELVLKATSKVQKSTR